MSYFTHAAFASVYPEAAALTTDQFELWWRSLSTEEKEYENTKVDLIRDLLGDVQEPPK